jgi:hypothetical protein
MQLQNKQIMIQEVNMDEEEAIEPMDDMIGTIFENLGLNEVQA